MQKQKLYCYVDETGQDTNGELFLVSIVLKESEEISIFEKELKAIEIRTGKHLLKWKRTPFNCKKEYIRQLIDSNILNKTIYYSIYSNSKDYSSLTSLTIAKTILSQPKRKYVLTIIIDGLNSKEREHTANELKLLHISFRKIRGLKDHQSIFLRLADSFAGFLREVQEDEEYTKDLYQKMKSKGIIKKI